MQPAYAIILHYQPDVSTCAVAISLRYHTRSTILGTDIRCPAGTGRAYGLRVGCAMRGTELAYAARPCPVLSPLMVLRESQASVTMELLERKDTESIVEQYLGMLAPYELATSCPVLRCPTSYPRYPLSTPFWPISYTLLAYALSGTETGYVLRPGSRGITLEGRAHEQLWQLRQVGCYAVSAISLCPCYQMPLLPDARLVLSLVLSREYVCTRRSGVVLSLVLNDEYVCTRRSGV
eukprot:957826-Rhodomonas_salina.1